MVDSGFWFANMLSGMIGVFAYAQSVGDMSFGVAGVGVGILMVVIFLIAFLSDSRIGQEV